MSTAPFINIFLKWQAKFKQSLMCDGKFNMMMNFLKVKENITWLLLQAQL